jgi:hypothetical protein
LVASHAGEHGRVVVRMKDPKRILDIVGSKGIIEIVPAVMKGRVMSEACGEAPALRAPRVDINLS